jgi:hypothetical protein
VKFFPKTHRSNQLMFDDAVHVVIASQSLILRLSNAVAKAASRYGGAAGSPCVSPVGGHLTAIRAWRQPPEISM